MQHNAFCSVRRCTAFDCTKWLSFLATPERRCRGHTSCCRVHQRNLPWTTAKLNCALSDDSWIQLYCGSRTGAGLAAGRNACRRCLFQFGAFSVTDVACGRTSTDAKHIRKCVGLRLDHAVGNAQMDETWRSVCKSSHAGLNLEFVAYVCVLFFTFTLQILCSFMVVKGLNTKKFRYH